VFDPIGETEEQKLLASCQKQAMPCVAAALLVVGLLGRSSPRKHKEARSSAPCPSSVILKDPVRSRVSKRGRRLA